MTSIPFSLIVAHFLGDWVLQTDWMALNKAKSWLALNAHCFVVGFVLLLWASIYYHDSSVGTAFAVYNWAAHIGIDFCTSRGTSYLWGKKQRHWFFVLIGFDQVLHYLVYALLLGRV